MGKERAIWTGSISFGLVNIPVRIFTATVSHDVAFHQVEEKTGQRIHFKRVAERSGREVPFSKIVKGYEVSRGKVVTIEPRELAALEPQKTRTIELEQFVDMHEIDPIFWDRTYYLAPEDKQGARKSYELLRRAMADTERVGVGRFVMRTKEYLTTIRPLGPGLALETMFFPDEIRGAIGKSDRKISVSPRELEMARQLIRSLEDRWNPDQFKDEYRDRVLDLIRRKARGQEVVQEAPPQPRGEAVDLMEALRASLGNKTNGHRPRGAAGARRGGRRTTRHRARAA